MSAAAFSCPPETRMRLPFGVHAKPLQDRSSREGGHFLFRGQIDNMKLMSRVAGISECEGLAIRADLGAQNHVAGFQLASRRCDPPAVGQQNTASVPAGYGNLNPAMWMLHV